MNLKTTSPKRTRSLLSVRGSVLFCHSSFTDDFELVSSVAQNHSGFGSHFKSGKRFFWKTERMCITGVGKPIPKSQRIRFLGCRHEPAGMRSLACCLAWAGLGHGLFSSPGPPRDAHGRSKGCCSDTVPSHFWGENVLGKTPRPQEPFLTWCEKSTLMVRGSPTGTVDGIKPSPWSVYVS